MEAHRPERDGGMGDGKTQSLQNVLVDLNFCYFLLFTTAITAL